MAIRIGSLLFVNVGKTWTAPGEERLIGLIPPTPSLCTGSEVTLNGPGSLFLWHGYPPDKTSDLCEKHSPCHCWLYTDAGLVDATATSADEQSGSDRIYLLRAYHYVGIFVWPLWWADVRLDTQAKEKATQGRREISPGRTPYPPRVSIKSHHWGQAVLPQERYHPLEGGFGMKVLMGLCAEQDGSPCIDKVEHLYHMVLLAFWIGGNSARIFKIHLNLLQRLAQLQGLVAAGRLIENTPFFPQDRAIWSW
jgi:hypothetical protein